MHRTPALIVGGGPAGAAAAILLAEGGRAPLLVERRSQPEQIVCGGFLSWDTLALLDRLGISAAALGAVPITRVRIITRDRVAEARLPGRAAGLSRMTLDSALLARAEAAGVTVRRGVAVRRIAEGEAELDDGSRIAAHALILATGKHGMRGMPRVDAAKGSVGLRTTMIAPPGLAGTIELHLFRGGYAGLLVQEDGRANLCLSVSPERLREAGGSPDALLAALVEEAPRLAAGLGARRSWSTIAGVPYGWRARRTEAGCFRVGDQAAVIASLVGDGIGIALASGISAADALLQGQTAGTWQKGFARRAAFPLGVAEAARGIAERPQAIAPLLPFLAKAPILLTGLSRLTRIGARSAG